MSKHFEALSGWYNLLYPEDWQFEIDLEGRYNFYNPNMGIGVLKISSFSASDNERIIQEELKDQCISSKPVPKPEDSVYFTGESKDKQHDLHFWITEKNQIKVFCTYTVDKFMVNENAAKEEFSEVGKILGSLQFSS